MPLMSKESKFISDLSTIGTLIGDDGALCGELVYSKDALFEDIHFKRKWLSLSQIAHRAIAINLSDAIAMNATASKMLIAVGIPKSFSTKEFGELARGFKEASKEAGIEIIGGDTFASDKLHITITLISKCTCPLRRKGLKRGDLLAYTGSVGKAKKELTYLLNGGKIHSASHFNALNLRAEFIASSSKFLSSGMDISDGIYSDLSRLSKINRVGFRFSRGFSKAQGCSGEEYEMLISFSARHKKRALRIAKRCRTPLVIFAKASRSAYKNPCKSHHF